MVFNLWLEDEKDDARREGREKGREEGLVYAAQKMLKRARDKRQSVDEAYMAEVAEITDLSMDRIKDLARQEGLIA